MRKSNRKNVKKKYCAICNKVTWCGTKKKITATTHLLALLSCVILCLPCIPYLCCLEKEYVCRECFSKDVTD